MKTYENLTTYNPGEIEGKWYSYWENQGYFHEEVDTNKEPFSIVLPPPNVTVDARYRPRWYCYTNQSRRDAC